MSDRTRAGRSRKTILLVTAALAFPGLAVAGETVVYAPPAAWVEPVKLPVDPSAQQVLWDTQHRLENGTVTSYIDSAVRIATPQAAMQQGTLALQWLPDKGDLIVHRVEIVRGKTSIDVLKTTPFSVLRREQGLEQRLLDGQLTATMAVPGLQVGDILRVTYSTTLADQALGKEMQLLQYLLPRPIQVDEAHTLVSWPDSETVHWRAERGVPAEAELRDGYRWLDISLPVAKAPDMPDDAPSRYRRPAVLRLGTYADWGEVARTMAPHFEAAANITAGSALDREAAAIMKTSSDPRTRAALAVQRVQDEVSYLLNGLNGGNYLPQNAEDTWTKRYGDCKAKSVLLVALLRRMGIEAEPVLVASAGGDALPELQPVPGNFDHVIAHARIDGTDYWLDGTNAGTRAANLDAVPPFFYALPLTAGSTGLVPMTPRVASQPDMAISMVIDQSAGVDLPTPYTVRMEFAGPQGAALRALAESQDPAMLRKLRESFYSGESDETAVASMKLSYDANRAVAVIDVSAIGASEFDWDASRLALSPDPDDALSDFNPDRARSEWRAIPVATGPTTSTRISVEYRLPGGDKATYTMQGAPALDGTAANSRVVRNAALAGQTLKLDYRIDRLGGEIAPEAVAEAKRANRRLQASALKVVAPADIARRWDLSQAEMTRAAAPVLAAYDAAVKAAEADELRPLAARALFRETIFDYAGALKDVDALIAKQADTSAYFTRSRINTSLGRDEAAIADLRQAYDLDPDNDIAYALADKLAYAGKAAEARALLESLPVSEDERAGYADNLATVTGLAGDTAGALSALEDELVDKPQDSRLLNADCWFRGLFKVALEAALDSCTRAVERSENAAAALDSRAMVQFRLGDYDAALTDLDAALALSPGLANSRYLRGIVRLMKGQAGGREDIAIAMRLAPELAARYARHGVKPPA